MNIYCIIWKFLPKFIQNIIKYVYMKWKISWNMCKLVQFTHLKTQSVKIWKNVKVWIWDERINEWVEIWDYTRFNDRNIIYSNKKFKVIFGKYCSIWNWASFIAMTTHDYNKLSTYNRFIPLSLWWNINVWHDVWIWKNAIILKGVTIWIGAVIWAWAVVTKDVPPYAIAWWNPAKVIKYRFDEKTIQKLLASEWRNRDIEKIKENYNLEFIKN